MDKTNPASCTIEVPAGKSYVRLTYRGRLTREQAIRENVRAHAFGRERGLSRYLVDVRLCPNSDTVSNNLSFVYEDMLTPGIDRGARVAILTEAADHSHDLPEAVSRVVGLDVTLFNDLALAEKHLMSGGERHRESPDRAGWIGGAP